MSTTILILIGIHLFLNGLVTGFYYSDQVRDDWRGWTDVLVLILSITLGLEFVIASFILVYVREFIDWFMSTTQLKFYFDFYFRKTYDVVTEEEWENMDNRYEMYLLAFIEKKGKMRLSAKHLMHCYKLVFKRHNHKFKTKREYRKEDDERRLIEFNADQIEKWDFANRDLTIDLSSLPECPSGCGAIKSPYSSKERYCHWCGEPYPEFNYNNMHDDEEE